jgi:hypothetical protein
MAKDLFSKQSDLYARYRPTYPKELYEYILSFVKEKKYCVGLCYRQWTSGSCFSRSF